MFTDRERPRSIRLLIRKHRTAQHLWISPGVSQYQSCLSCLGCIKCLHSMSSMQPRQNMRLHVPSRIEFGYAYRTRNQGQVHVPHRSIIQSNQSEYSDPRKRGYTIAQFVFALQHGMQSAVVVTNGGGRMRDGCTRNVWSHPLRCLFPAACRLPFI
jgi:hypothetical protein